MGTADLYGSNDPFQRMPRTPKVLADSTNVEDFIVKVDLGNYSQLNAEKAEDGGEDSPASGQPPLPQTAKVDTLIEEKVTESLTK